MILDSYANGRKVTGGRFWHLAARRESDSGHFVRAKRGYERVILEGDQARDFVQALLAWENLVSNFQAKLFFIMIKITFLILAVNIQL